MATNEKVYQSIEETRKQPIVGEVVFWRLYELEAPLDDFKEKYESLELPEHCFVAKRDRSALTKSIKVMETQNLIRKSYESDSEIRYVIVKERKDESSKDIEFVKKNTVIFDKNTKEVRFKSSSADTSTIKELFEKYRHLITGFEVSRIFVRLVTDVGITMNNGGAYFVPKSKIDRIDKMEELLKHIKQGHILRLGIADYKAYKTQLQKAVTEDITGSIRKVKGEVKTLRKDNPDGIKEFVVNRRMIKLTRLEEKIKLFKFLDVDTENLTAETKKYGRILKKLRRDEPKELH